MDVQRSQHIMYFFLSRESTKTGKHEWRTGIKSGDKAPEEPLQRGTWTFFPREWLWAPGQCQSKSCRGWRSLDSEWKLSSCTGMNAGLCGRLSVISAERLFCVCVGDAVCLLSLFFVLFSLWFCVVFYVMFFFFSFLCAFCRFFLIFLFQFHFDDADCFLCLLFFFLFSFCMCVMEFYIFVMPLIFSVIFWLCFLCSSYLWWKRCLTMESTFTTI